MEKLKIFLIIIKVLQNFTIIIVQLKKIKDLFSQTSVDYDKKSPRAREFFAQIQNKLIFAETGKTAAELIMEIVQVWG